MTAVLVAAQAPKPKTVWDGVYTDAQAARAQATFDSVCSRCHMLTGQGKGALTGDAFWTAFTQKSVADLSDIRQDEHAERERRLAAGVDLRRSRRLDSEVERISGRRGGRLAGSRRGRPDISKDGPSELPANVLARVVGCLAKSGSDWVLTRATAPERIDKSAIGAGRRDASAGRPLRHPQIRADPARCLSGPADVGERHPPRHGRGGRHQRNDR